MATTLFVCVTCRAGGPADAPVPGARLHDALSALAGVECGDVVPAEIDTGAVRIVPVECLGACDSGCVVAVQGRGKWSYVYGRLGTEHAPDILAGTRLYAAAPDGIVPWRERPTVFRRHILARIPAPETP